MATRHVKAIIQLRRANEADWCRLDPVLRLGEPAYSLDVNKIKFGDGHSKWSELNYLEADASITDFHIDCGTSKDV